MKSQLNKHVSYKSYPEILSNYDAIIKDENTAIIHNGLGICGRLYIQANNHKILLPAPLHPMLLSAVNGNEGKYVVDHNGKQNGPFLGVGCAKWLQDFAITTARILEEAESKKISKDLYQKFDMLNKEDLIKHGRIGEGLYILFDLIKAYKDGAKYHSPTKKEYKLFVKDLQNICQGKKVDINGYINDLPQSFKNILVSKDGAIYRYAVEQFPEMVKPNSKVAYYDLSKDVIDERVLPKNYQVDFNNKINNESFIEKTHLKKIHTIDDISTPTSNPQSNYSTISKTTIAFIVSTAIFLVAGVSTLALSLFDVVNMSNNIGFAIVATAGLFSIATGLSVVYNDKLTSELKVGKEKNNNLSADIVGDRRASAFWKSKAKESLQQSTGVEI